MPERNSNLPTSCEHALVSGLSNIWHRTELDEKTQAHFFKTSCQQNLCLKVRKFVVKVQSEDFSFDLSNINPQGETAHDDLRLVNEALRVEQEVTDLISK